jgi:hypothetical protein
VDALGLYVSYSWARKAYTAARTRLLRQLLVVNREEILLE